MTGRVAPHAAAEVRLVQAGTKPLATIEKKKTPILYSIAVACRAAGMIYGEVIQSSDSPEGEIVITSVKNKGLVKQYKELLATGVKEFGIKEYHRRMGALFGYRSEDIEAFIQAEIQCNCTKCKGA
jgi:hypothetical protein